MKCLYGNLIPIMNQKHIRLFPGRTAIILSESPIYFLKSCKKMASGSLKGGQMEKYSKPFLRKNYGTMWAIALGLLLILVYSLTPPSMNGIPVRKTEESME